MKQRILATILVPFLVPGVPLIAGADESGQVELGLRANVMLGHGKPANDILGAGVTGRYRLTNGWFVGAAIDSYQYDFERPAKVLGIRQDPAENVIDADAEFTAISASLGRVYEQAGNKLDWFWTLGVGFASPKADDVTGPTEAGGTFDITFDFDDEIHLMGSIGASYHFSAAWSASLRARLEHHFMDIVITDRVTGNTATIDAQTAMGASLSLNYRF